MLKADISIGRLRGGFCAHWRDEEGKRHRYQLAALTRAEAEAEAISVWRRHTEQRKPEELKVAEIWAGFIRHLGPKPTARTMCYTGKAILPHFGPFQPDQIDADLCRRYTEMRLKAGKKIGTIYTELGHLQSALNFAAKARFIPFAPHIERPSKPTGKERYLTRPEVARLIEATQAPHIRLAVMLLLSTAGRIGAVLDLTWDRVDFERGQINLRLPDSVTRKGRAIVPMNASLKAALSVAKEAALSDYVVEYAMSQVKNIRTGFQAAVRRAGLKDVTIHSLRHTAAVTMVSEGIPIEKVAQYLGHSNPSITYSTYARYAPDHLRDAAEVLDFFSLKQKAASR